MVDVITPTVTYFGTNSKTPAMKATFAGFDAATEYGIFDAWDKEQTWIPSGCIAIVTRTDGSQNTIDIDVDVSMDGTTYVAGDINNITAKDTYEQHPSVNYAGADDAAAIRWRYWKVYIVDEGEGNTLTVDLWFF